MWGFVAAAVVLLVLSVPLDVLLEKRHLWRDVSHPRSRLLIGLTWAIRIGIVLSLAFDFLYPHSPLAAPLFLWVGLLYFVYVWVRGVYLLLTRSN